MPFLLAEILNFQGSTHRIGVGSFSYVIRNMIGRNAASYAMGQSFSYLKNWEIKTTYVNHVHIINGKIRIYKEPLTYLVYKG